MFVIDSETHPIGVMDIDRYRPWEPEAFPAPTMEALPGRQSGRLPGLRMGPRDWYVDDLISVMDRYGINKSVVMSGGIQVTNDNLAAAVSQYPDRLLAFASYEHYQPCSREPDVTAKAVVAMERAVKELGCKGIGELIPERFTPDPPSDFHGELRPMMEVCKKYRIPVFIHTGFIHSGYDPVKGPAEVIHRIRRDGGEGSPWSYHPCELRYRDPIYLEKVAEEYPEVVIIAVHMGGVIPEHFQRMLALARRHRNVYLTAAGSPPDFIATAAAELGADRMIWGSDWAYRSAKAKTPPEELAQPENLRSLEQAGLKPAQKEAILGRTLADLLNIPAQG